ncbi:MAG: FHA domain-containing protein [Prevotella sp.]|nr:FHA domain-containing protein [Prevotella sp.]MBP3843101.1 FHA domain-containing protein [Prevotella sp.]
MSQNKTVIQGLEPDNSSQPYGMGGNGNSQFYNRQANMGGSASRGTVVPGMGGYQQQPAQGGQPVQTVQQQQPRNLGKPMVGLLYSVSRTAAGEYWPLQIGQNTIGSNPNCDIQLPEGTVSAEHAVLVVRKMKNPEKVIASISDARSTNGTMLNGVSLGFSAEECKNGDIITIGDNYELYLVLLDAASLGLKVKESFIPIETEEPAGPMSFDPNATQMQQFGPDPSFYGGQAGGGFAQGGTVGLDGSSAFGAKGGTVGI